MNFHFPAVLMFHQRYSSHMEQQQQLFGAKDKALPFISLCVMNVFYRPHMVPHSPPADNCHTVRHLGIKCAIITSFFLMFLFQQIWPTVLFIQLFIHSVFFHPIIRRNSFFHFCIRTVFGPVNSALIWLSIKNEQNNVI